MKINGVILAAGQSSRLGQDKQLVQFKGTSLIRHTEQLMQAVVNHLYVVLGHNHEAIEKELTAATILINKNWQMGMGTSLSCGAELAQAAADAILIALCDQPRIPSSHFNEMVYAAAQHPNKIIATGYADISGVPAIFPKQYFFDLTQLTGQQGAQHLMVKNNQDVITLTCDSAAFDVDNKNQLNQLRP